MRSPTDGFRLANGMTIPCLGFGTWQVKDGDTTKNAVLEALRVGYRHIDTAAAYGNEKSVGQAIAESGIERDRIFLTTKLWNSERGYESTLRAFDKSCAELGTDYVDLYLIHWPAAKGDPAEWQLTNARTWKAFEKLYADGRARAIGVSNFKPHHLEPLIEEAEITPLVNQIEFHPGYTQEETLAYCERHEIVVEAWSPLGSGRVLQEKALAEVAAKYNKSVAQLCIRWCMQNGTLPLPKSVTPERIRENADIFDFSISQEDMDAVNALPAMGFSGQDPDTVNF